MKSHRNKPNETITAKVRELEKTRDKMSSELSSCSDPEKIKRLSRVQHSLNAKIQILGGHFSDPSSTIRDYKFSEYKFSVTQNLKRFR